MNSFNILALILGLSKYICLISEVTMVQALEQLLVWEKIWVSVRTWLDLLIMELGEQ